MILFLFTENGCGFKIYGENAVHENGGFFVILGA